MLPNPILKILASHNKQGRLLAQVLTPASESKRGDSKSDYPPAVVLDSITDNNEDNPFLSSKNFDALQFLKCLFSKYYSDLYPHRLVFFFKAFEFGCDENVIHFFVKDLKIDPKSKDKNNNTAFYYAATAKSNRVQMLKTLTDYGCDHRTHFDQQGGTVLHRAAVYNCPDVVEHLLATEPQMDPNLPLKISQGDDQKLNLEGTNSLHLAAQKGHLEVLKRLVARGGNINRANKQGVTPLLHAVQNNHPAVAFFIMEYPSFDFKMEPVPLVLDAVISIDNVKLLKSILRPTGNKQNDFSVLQKLDVPDEKGEYFVHKAARTASKCLDFLICFYPDVLQKKNKFDENALHVAIETVNLDGIVLLVRHKKELLEEESRIAGTPLSSAVYDLRLGPLRLLLQLGATNRIKRAPKDNYINQPICQVFKKPNEKITQPISHASILVEMFHIFHLSIPGFWLCLSDFNIKLRLKILLRIANEPHPKLSLSIIKKNLKDQKFQDFFGISENDFLEYAEQIQELAEIVLLQIESNKQAPQLLQAESQERKDLPKSSEPLEPASGFLPIHQAAARGNSQDVKDYIEKKGISVHAITKDDAQSTCTHLAARNGHIQILELLQDYKADFKTPDKFGMTPLMYAGAQGQVAAFQWIRQRYPSDLKMAIPELKVYPEGFESGNTIAHLASHFEGAPILKTLADEGVLSILDIPNRKGKRPIHVAARAGNERTLSFWLEQKVPVTTQTEDDKNSLLHLAASSQKWATMKLLLEHKADPYMENSSHQYPIISAFESMRHPLENVQEDPVTLSKISVLKRYLMDSNINLEPFMNLFYPENLTQEQRSALLVFFLEQDEDPVYLLSYILEVYKIASVQQPNFTQYYFGKSEEGLYALAAQIKQKKGLTLPKFISEVNFYRQALLPGLWIKKNILDFYYQPPATPGNPKPLRMSLPEAIVIHLFSFLVPKDIPKVFILIASREITFNSYIEGKQAQKIKALEAPLPASRESSGDVKSDAETESKGDEKAQKSKEDPSKLKTEKLPVLYTNQLMLWRRLVRLKPFFKVQATREMKSEEGPSLTTPKAISAPTQHVF